LFFVGVALLARAIAVRLDAVAALFVARHFCDRRVSSKAFSGARSLTRSASAETIPIKPISWGHWDAACCAGAAFFISGVENHIESRVFIFFGERTK
jgi:hypothetical protein